MSTARAAQLEELKDEQGWLRLIPLASKRSVTFANLGTPILVEVDEEFDTVELVEYVEHCE